jgi:hypothetical protein
VRWIIQIAQPGAGVSQVSREVKDLLSLNHPGQIPVKLRMVVSAGYDLLEMRPVGIA